MIKKLINLTILLTAIGISFSSTALACNCGCVGCGAMDEKQKQAKKEEKLLCEAPKDWFSLLKHLEQRIQKTNVVCNADCNSEGGKK